MIWIKNHRSHLRIIIIGIFVVLFLLLNNTILITSSPSHSKSDNNNDNDNNNNNETDNSIINRRTRQSGSYIGDIGDGGNDNGGHHYRNHQIPISTLENSKSSSSIVAAFSSLASPPLSSSSSLSSAPSSSAAAIIQNQFVKPIVLLDLNKNPPLPPTTNVSSSSSYPSNKYDFYCATQFGYYRDPGNCSSYFICTFGIPLHKNCSEGLYFSERLQTCDWPNNVPCEQDFASLNAETSMFNLIDDSSNNSNNKPNSFTTPSPAWLLLYNNNYTASPSSNTYLATSAPYPFDNYNRNNLSNGNFPVVTPPSTIPKPITQSPTLISSSPSISSYGSSSSSLSYVGQSLNQPKSSLIQSNNSSGVSSTVNTLNKHDSINGKKELRYESSVTYVVDGFEVSPTATTTISKNKKDKFESNLDHLNNNKKYDNLKIIYTPYNYNNNGSDRSLELHPNAKFMEINKLNDNQNNNNNNNNDNDNRDPQQKHSTQNQANQMFQKRRGGYETYWPVNGYMNIDEKRINPFSIYDRPQIDFNNNNNNNNSQITYVTTNPYIMNNDQQQNNRRKPQDPYYWYQNLDSNNNNKKANHQNVFQSINFNDNNNSDRYPITTMMLKDLLTTTKPTNSGSTLRRKIPDLFIKMVDDNNNNKDNVNPGIMPRNIDGGNGSGVENVNQDIIVFRSEQKQQIEDNNNNYKRLNYEINERLLAPFKHSSKNDNGNNANIDLIQLENMDKNNNDNNAEHSNVSPPPPTTITTKSINYNGVNRYSSDQQQNQKFTSSPIQHSLPTTDANTATTASNNSRFKKKIIRKMKKMNYPNEQRQPPQQQQQQSSSTPTSTGLAASSSSTNMYGHPSTHLLTGSLVTRATFNNNKNNDQIKVRLNSRPPLYEPAIEKENIDLNYHNPNSLPNNLSSHLPATTPIPIIPVIALSHPTTIKPRMPTQRNRPQTSSPQQDTFYSPAIMDLIDKSDKPESIVLVPMYESNHKANSNNNYTPRVNPAQYNSYVVIPSSTNKNNNNNNDNIQPHSNSNNKRFESKYKTTTTSTTKAPLDSLEEFIRLTIEDKVDKTNKINQKQSTTTTAKPTITPVLAPIQSTPAKFRSSFSTTTAITPPPPPSSTQPPIVTTPQQEIIGLTREQQVYKKIKTINGYRRSRKYRPLISLDQQQNNVPIKRYNISTVATNHHLYNHHHHHHHHHRPDYYLMKRLTTNDLIINNNNNATNKANINLSDPSTISTYETLKTNDLEQQQQDQRFKSSNNYSHQPWPLTTTPSPMISSQQHASYGDRNINHNHRTTPTTAKPDYVMKNIDIPTDMMNTIPSLSSTTKAPRITNNYHQHPSQSSSKKKVAIRVRTKGTTPITSTTTTTTTTTTTMAPPPHPDNSSEYNYYDYDNYDGTKVDDSGDDYDINNYDDEYYNNLLNENTVKEMKQKSTSSTTSTTTTTTPMPSSQIYYRRQNVTSKPLIYLRNNKPRPTNRRLIIKDPDENNKFISASRPKPLYPQPKALISAGKCDKRKCRLPDCRCGSSDIPGDLPSKQIPQIVMLTFDDAVNDLNWELYEEILNTGRTNPNGCPIKATFYVSHEWTDYGQVQTLYSRGHEIASHTISHRFGEKFTKDEWIKEINGQREILHLYGGVKFEDIRGMRAPFLQTGGNNMFEMLYETNFTYDSSLPVQENHPPYWPYTLDYSLSHSCNIPPCPTKSFPGVWEVGMVMWSDLRGGRCSMGDACTNPSDEAGVYEMLIKNFNRHYKTNRAPFSLYYHSAWFNTQHHKKGFMKFLDEILQNQDVYLLTTWQMLQWVREPTTLDRLDSFEPFQCNQQKPIDECTRAKACNVHSKQGSRTLRTCQECPQVFPWIGNTGFSKSKYG